jgi:hypothetical protein
MRGVSVTTVLVAIGRLVAVGVEVSVGVKVGGLVGVQVAVGVDVTVSVGVSEGVKLAVELGRLEEVGDGSILVASEPQRMLAALRASKNSAMRIDPLTRWFPPSMGRIVA